MQVTTQCTRVQEDVDPTAAHQTLFLHQDVAFGHHYLGIIEK